MSSTADRLHAKEHAAAQLEGVESCLHCGYRFRNRDETRVVQLCDRCFSDVMRWLVSSRTPAQTHARLKAAHRLYGRRDR